MADPIIKYDRKTSETRIYITETDADSSAEVELDVPTKGVIRKLASTLVSGSGATVLPSANTRGGRANDTQFQVFRGPNNNVPAAHINEQQPVHYDSPLGKLFHKSNVDTGSDNTIVTEYIIAPRRS